MQEESESSGELPKHAQTKLASLAEKVAKTKEFQSMSVRIAKATVLAGEEGGDYKDYLNDKRVKGITIYHGSNDSWTK